MLAIQKSAKSDVCAVNIVPCRVHHTGPIKVTKRHWNPSIEKDSSKVTYFRGRKLKGTALTIPKGYQAIVVKSTERNLVSANAVPHAPVDSDSDDEDEVRPDPVKILEHVSDVKEITVWGHDQLPPTDDAYHKGVDEWISFAQAVHGS